MYSAIQKYAACNVLFDVGNVLFDVGKDNLWWDAPNEYILNFAQSLNIVFSVV